MRVSVLQAKSLVRNRSAHLIAIQDHCFAQQCLYGVSKCRLPASALPRKPNNRMGWSGYLTLSSSRDLMNVIGKLDSSNSITHVSAITDFIDIRNDNDSHEAAPVLEGFLNAGPSL